MPRLEFWYEFASTYSYLSAMRIEALAEQSGVEIEWRPFLLGPIFKAQGWDTSPFNLYPAKGRYMIRDLERLAAERGLAFHLPSPFPANSLKAARLALIGAAEGWVVPFSRAVFEAEFARSQNISDNVVLGEVLTSLGLDSGRLFAHAEEAAIKQRLKDRVDVAASRGIFGAPSFVAADGELFWGDDRLEQALRWASRL
jgi:2-hydroxychromene-2-carboxylate isomerase